MNWHAPEDEDFKEAGSSSAATAGNQFSLWLTYLDEFDDKELHDFEADALLDPAEVVDKVGDTLDCFHNQGKVFKEVLQVGQGTDKPKMGALCRIRYIAYFYDKEIFDSQA